MQHVFHAQIVQLRKCYAESGKAPTYLLVEEPKNYSQKQISNQPIWNRSWIF